MDLLKIKNTPRPSIIIGVNREKVSPDLERELLACVNGTRELVCTVASGPGRSIYAPPTQDGLPGIKMKGAGGLKRRSRSSLGFYSPQPGTSYSSEVSHMALDPALNFVLVQSRPKALNSLLAKGARMEYVAQTRLHEHDIGFDGLCWGEFLGENGEGERDVNGYQTGFIISEHDLSYEPLSRVLAHEVDGNGHLGERLHHDTLKPEKLDLHFGIVRRLGEVKKRMSLDAELARHSSTLSNFLYSVERDHLIVTDTDTLLDCREMNPEARGSQFLRDSVSDLMKRIKELQFADHSEKTPLIIRQVIVEFLTGLFGDSVKKEAINAAVDELNIPTRIQKVASSLKASKTSANISGWIYFGHMFPEVYRAVYRLLLKSDLPDKLPIQRIDPDILHQRARTFLLANACM